MTCNRCGRWTWLVVALLVGSFPAFLSARDEQPAKPQSAQEIAADWVYKEAGDTHTLWVAPKESPKLYTSTTRISSGSFEGAWNFYAQKCGTDKKYSAKNALVTSDETKDGQYVILDNVDAFNKQTASTFAYNTKGYTVAVHLRQGEDQKNIYLSVTVGLR